MMSARGAAGALPVQGTMPPLDGATHGSTPSRSRAKAARQGRAVDFWTYSCINCIRALPYVEAWHENIATKVSS